MKKFRLLFFSSFLWFLYAIVVVFALSTAKSAFANNYEWLEYSFQSAQMAVERNGTDHTIRFETAINRISETPAFYPISDHYPLTFQIPGVSGIIIIGADITFLYSEFAYPPYIFSIVEMLNINQNLDFDITDIPEGSKINDRREFISLSDPERTPALMVRCLSEEVFLFPPQASRLRI